MLTYCHEMSDDSMIFDSTTEWSLQRTTKLLTDESMYSSSELFGYPESSFDSTTRVKLEAPYDEWEYKTIDQWSSQDCLLWLIHELQDLNITNPITEVKVELIAHMCGKDLKNMTEQGLNELFPCYGTDLFYRLQKIKSRYNYCTYNQWNTPPIPVDEVFPRYTQEPPILTDLDNESHVVPFTPPSEPADGYKSDSSITTVTPEAKPVVEKRRPGRPRGSKKKKKPEKLGRLWEFIRDLLLNPQYNPSMICWENYEEGMFRFVHSDRVAKLWGSKKENEDMNYEKLSRAMRYYYKSQVLLPVYGKRLVYKFGPTATGWRSENPIMRCQG